MKKVGSDTGTPDLLAVLLVHRMFRKEFAALAREAADGHDAARTEALEEQLAMVLHVLHEHHTGEDTMIWPALRRRSPGSAAVLDAMEAEHDELDPLIHVAGDTSLPLAERAEPLRRLAERLGAHLDREEREALPLVERHLTAGEFTAMDKVMMKKVGGDLPALAGAVLWHATPDERERLLASFPRILGVMWRLSWRRRYARRYARAYGRPTERVSLRTAG